MHRGLASDPRQAQLPQFFLVVTPEVSDDVHHRLTVDLAVSADALHKFEYEAAFGPANLIDDSTLRALLRAASEAADDHRFSGRFLETE